RKGSASQDRVFDLADVVFHYVDIGGGRAVRAGQRVRIERTADLDAGFGGDLLDQTRIGDVFHEDRCRLVVPDLFDQPGDVGGGGFRIRRKALRGEEAQPVFVFEIAEGVVRGDDHALFGGNGGDGGAHFAVERLQLLRIGFRVAAIGIAAGGIGGAEGVGDV